MPSINSINTHSITALHLLKPILNKPDSYLYSSQIHKDSLADGSRPQISVSIQQALSEINRIIQNQQYERTDAIDHHFRPNQRLDERVQLKSGNFMEPAQTLDELSEYEREQILSFGINPEFVRRITPPEVSDTEFHEMVIGYLNEAYSDNSAFLSSLQNGTLSIQRARDVPEISTGMTTFSYKDNIGFGSVGFHKGGLNYELLAERRAQGVQQITGGIKGQEFYVTWPDESLKAS